MEVRAGTVVTGTDLSHVRFCVGERIACKDAVDARAKRATLIEAPVLNHALGSGAGFSRDNMFGSAVKPTNDQLIEFRTMLVNGIQSRLTVYGCKGIRNVEAQDACARVNSGMGCDEAM